MFYIGSTLFFQSLPFSITGVELSDFGRMRNWFVLKYEKQDGKIYEVRNPIRMINNIVLTTNVDMVTDVYF